LLQIVDTLVWLVIIEVSHSCFYGNISQELSDSPHALIFGWVYTQSVVQFIFEVLDSLIYLALSYHVLLHLHELLEGPIEVTIVYRFFIIHSWWRFQTIGV
jgi:hypothetical protein